MTSKRRLHVGRAAGGIAAISTGTVAGQLVTLLATPVLSRAYSPAAYGAFASLMATVAIMSTAGSLRLESAVPIASGGDAKNMVRASAVSSFAAGLMLAGLLRITNSAALSEAPWLGAILVTYLVWVSSMYSVLTAFSLRRHQYGAVARRNLVQTVGTATGQISLSRWTQTGLGLTAGLAIGRSLGLATLVREGHVLSKESGSPSPRPSQTWRRYWRFPVIFMPSALLNVLATQLPILLVTRAHGTESAGNLAQAIMLGAFPAALLGSAIASVLMAEIAGRVRTGQFYQRPRYIRATKALLPLGIGWFIFLVIVAPRLLPIILGSEWNEAGAFAAAIAVGVATGLVVSPLSVVFLLYEKATMNIMGDAFRFTLVLFIGMISWRLGLDSVKMVLAMSCAMGVVYVGTWIVGLRIVSQRQD